MPLDFACKTFSINQVLRCSFGLNKTEFKVLKLLLSHERTVKQLIKKLVLDQSTIQRALTNLLDKALVKRYQRNLKKGGYIYYYKAVNKEVIKQRVSEVFNNFKEMAAQAINDW